MEGNVALSVEYGANTPVSANNLAIHYGFDPSVVVWSEDSKVRSELERLLSFAKDTPEMMGKSLSGLDLRNEKPFDLSSARFEDLDMRDLLLPKGTNLQNAHFVGCNVYGMNFYDCEME